MKKNPKVYAQAKPVIHVFCKQHDVDEPYYDEYVSSPEVADAWIKLHNLQKHGVQ